MFFLLARQDWTLSDARDTIVFQSLLVKFVFMRYFGKLLFSALQQLIDVTVMTYNSAAKYMFSAMFAS